VAGRFSVTGFIFVLKFHARDFCHARATGLFLKLSKCS
jgi:hypothetical protein